MMRITRKRRMRTMDNEHNDNNNNNTTIKKKTRAWDALTTTKTVMTRMWDKDKAGISILELSREG